MTITINQTRTNELVKCHALWVQQAKSSNLISPTGDTLALMRRVVDIVFGQMRDDAVVTLDAELLTFVQAKEGEDSYPTSKTPVYLE